MNSTTTGMLAGIALGFAAAACVVLGAGLLLCAVLSGKPTVLPLRDDDPDTGSTVDSGATRRSLRKVLRAAASSVDGVTTTRLGLGRRTITATVSTDRTITDGLAAAVRGAVENRLDHIGPDARPAAVGPNWPRAPSPPCSPRWRATPECTPYAAPSPDGPALALVISTTQDGEPGVIRRSLVESGLPRLRQALGIDELPTTVEFHLTGKTGPRTPAPRLSQAGT